MNGVEGDVSVRPPFHIFKIDQVDQNARTPPDSRHHLLVGCIPVSDFHLHVLQTRSSVFVWLLLLLHGNAKRCTVLWSTPAVQCD